MSMSKYLKATNYLTDPLAVAVNFGEEPHEKPVTFEWNFVEMPKEAILGGRHLIHLGELAFCTESKPLYAIITK